MKFLSRILLVAMTLRFAQSLNTVDTSADTRRFAASVLFAMGLILVAAGLTGKIFSQIKLPKLTGYLGLGMLVGPYVLGLVDSARVSNMQFVNGVAVSLIALTAGSEMDLRAMRPLLRSILFISLVAIVGTAIILSGTIFLLRPYLSFFHGMSLQESIAVSAVLGVVIASQSPAVVVALRAETGADGPIMRTILGVVVMGDLLIIVLFTLASAAANAVLEGRIDAINAALNVSWELFGSIGIGLLIGGTLSAYMRFVGRGGLGLYVLAVCLVAAEIGRRLHLDPLLLMLGAGMFVENFSHKGHELRDAFEDASLPVYILFFTLAGASIHLDALPVVAIPAGILVLTRASGFLFGTRIGAKMAGAEPNVAKFAGFGLVPQAGLAIALSLLLPRTFPSFGADAMALSLGIVAINEIVAPAILRIALIRSGEAKNAGDEGRVSHSHSPGWESQGWDKSLPGYVLPPEV